MDHGEVSVQVRPMTKKIDPDLFARLMKLSSGTRTDLLEYLGQTPVSDRYLTHLSAYATSTRGDRDQYAKANHT